MQAFQLSTERILGQKWTPVTAESVQSLLANPSVRYFSIGSGGEGLAATQEVPKGGQAILVKKARPVILDTQILDQVDFKLVAERGQRAQEGHPRASQSGRRGLFANLPDFAATAETATKNTIKFQSDIKQAAVHKTLLSLLEKETDFRAFWNRAEAAIGAVNLGQPAGHHIPLAQVMHPAVTAFLERFWNLVFIFNPVFDQTSPRLRFLYEVIQECLKSSDTPTADKLRKATKRIKSLLQLRCGFIRRVRGADAGEQGVRRRLGPPNHLVLPGNSCQ